MWIYDQIEKRSGVRLDKKTKNSFAEVFVPNYLIELFIIAAITVQEHFATVPKSG